MGTLPMKLLGLFMYEMVMKAGELSLDSLDRPCDHQACVWSS